MDKNKVFKVIGAVTGILFVGLALLVGQSIVKKGSALGAAVPSYGDLPGIYNATGTDLVLSDGSGSALAVDRYGRLILSASSTLGSITGSGAANGVTLWDGTSSVTNNNNLTFTDTGSARVFNVSGNISTNTSTVSSTRFIASAGAGGTVWPIQYSFSGDEDSGLAQTSDSVIRIIRNGVSSWMFGSQTQVAATVIPTANITYDIGATPTWRWRYLYASAVYASTTSHFDGINLGATNTNITAGAVNAREPISLTACGGLGNVTNPAGGPNQVETPTNFVNTCALHYSPSALNKATWSFLMPNNWDGSSVTATFVYFTTGTNTGGATFGIRGYTVNPGNSLDGSWGSTSTVTFGPNGTSLTGTYSSSVTMVLGGTPTGGRKVFFEVSRAGADSTDTLTDWAALSDVYIQYGKKSYSDL